MQKGLRSLIVIGLVALCSMLSADRACASDRFLLQKSLSCCLTKASVLSTPILNLGEFKISANAFDLFCSSLCKGNDSQKKEGWQKVHAAASSITHLDRSSAYIRRLSRQVRDLPKCMLCSSIFYSRPLPWGLSGVYAAEDATIIDGTVIVHF